MVIRNRNKRNRCRGTTESFLLCLVLTILILSCARPLKQPPALSPLTRTPFSIPEIPPTEETLAVYLSRLEKDPEDPYLNRDVGTLYQVFSQPANWAYIEKAIVYLEKARETLADDAQTLLYLGLARAARGKNPELGLLGKFSSAQKGFHHLDQAVVLEPNNFIIRLVRAKAILLAPSFLGKSGILAEEHQWLFNRIRPEAKPPLPDHLRILGLIFLGDHQYRVVGNKREAKRYWKEALSFDSPYTETAALRLKGDFQKF